MATCVTIVLPEGHTCRFKWYGKPTETTIEAMCRKAIAQTSKGLIGVNDELTLVDEDGYLTLLSCDLPNALQLWLKLPPGGGSALKTPAADKATASDAATAAGAAGSPATGSPAAGSTGSPAAGSPAGSRAAGSPAGVVPSAENTTPDDKAALISPDPSD